MRTKLLLITAAIGAASTLALNAQVYSVNAVGYINLELKAGLNLVANQLDNGNGNTVVDVLAGVPDGTTVYKFSPDTGYTINTYDASFDEWSDATMSLSPGEGFWVGVSEDTTVTLVGEVPQGTLVNPIAAGINLISSIVPQAGGLVTDLGYPVADGDTVYKWENGSYVISTYDAGFDEWSPSEPSIGVGEGFWILTANAVEWTRDFSVNE
jgi:hypothetical protein